MENDNNNPDNNNPNTEQNTAETPSGMSEEQVIRLVNQAVSSHVKRRSEKLDKKFDEFSSQIQALLTNNAPTTTTEEPTEEGDRVDNQTKAFQAQLNKLSEKLQQSEQLRAEEKSHNRDLNARNTLKDALTAAGVSGDRIKHAMAFIYDGKDKMVNYTDSGELEFTLEKDGYTQYLSVQEGVNAFLDTDDGKFFLPPRDVAGSGNKGGNNRPARGRGRTDQPSDEEALRMLGDFMLQGKL